MVYGSPANIATAARGVKEGLATIKVNKKLKESEYNDLKDAFNLESGVNQSIIDLVEVDGALKIIENKAKKQVKKDEITQEEANDIVNNFNEIHTATRQTKAAKIEKEFQPGIIDNLAKKNKLVKQIKQVDDAALSAPLVEEVKLLNASIKEGMLGSREVSSKNLLGKAKAIAEQIGTLSIEESNSAEQTENIVARIHAEDDKAGVNRRENSLMVLTIASRKAPKCVPPCVVFCPLTNEWYSSEYCDLLCVKAISISSPSR